MSELDARFAALEPADQTSFLAFIEFLEWKRYDRPEIRQSDGMKRASEQAPRFRAIRETLGKSLQECADAAGVAVATYAHFETRGPRRWSSVKEADYCETFGVNAAWLMRGEGEMFCRGHGPIKVRRAPESTVIAFPRRGTP